jgi:peptidoglycan hydrolase-like protein with peptidoglycan-binding domain
MKRVSVVFVLGVAAFLAGCGEKNNQASTVTPMDQLSTNEEAMMLLNNEIPSGDEVAAPDISLGAQDLSQSMPSEDTLMVSENPTDQQIQQALQNAGLYQGSLDGVLGKKSKEAIKTFQEQNGLTVDGKVGKKTWAILSSYLNAAPVSTVPMEQAD